MSADPYIHPEIPGRLDARNVDRWIGDLAERQHGRVARRQLLAAGIGPGAIDHRVARGRLRPEGRGVYAVGHAAATREGRWSAAVLGSGEGAVLSHRSAAALWGLRVRESLVEVAAPRRRRSSRGVRLRELVLPSDECTVLHDIPVTTVPRTLMDLAGALPRAQLERALHEAEYLRLTDVLSLPDLIARHPGVRGVAVLRTLLAEQDVGADVTDSELEDRFIAFVDAHDLPRPLLNRWVLGFRADAMWPDARIIIELDGRRAHGTSRRFETDRARDRALLAAGWRVVRVTWRQLERDPGALAADLRAIRRAAGATV